MIRVAIVDDHPVVRLGLCMALAASDRICLVGEGGSLVDALRLAETSAPDVLLLDLRLPDGRGLDALTQLRALRPELHVLILTGAGTVADAREALARGARGYLTKDDLVSTIVETVVSVKEGAIVVAPSVQAELLMSARDPSLTKRELEVLALVVEGCTNPEIAAMLGLSSGTVRTHVSHILEKLGVADRTEATAVALRRGIV